MRHSFKQLFRWQPSEVTLVPAVAGFVVILLSVAMIPTKHISWLYIMVRDVALVSLVGVYFPLQFILRNGRDFIGYGLSFRKWYIFLPINLGLAVLLFFMFLSESPPLAGFQVNPSVLWRITYIMLTEIFEIVFFYSFQRTLFERAFGIVPAIILTAVFYAFHHVGFQPEFGKLIFVGLLYAIVFRLGNSALLIYPFFWGVGASYDVLVQSKVVSEIAYPEVRSLLLIVLFTMAMASLWRIAGRSAGDLDGALSRE